jgi:2-succinyl-6-hydroxy-2,4-cyclohexadiene-1-carboxylate synthase
MNQLPDKTYAVAVDLPGHGETEADLKHLDFESLSGAIVDFINEQLKTPPIVVGYSMGGRIALYMALKYPESVGALVLESSSPGIENASERESRLIQDEKRADSLRRSGLRAFLADWYEQPLFNSLKSRSGMVESIIQKKLDNSADNLAEVMVRLSPGRQKPLWEDLRKWDKPTLIIAGELDGKYCDIAHRMASITDQSELKLISDAGHIAHLENKKDFIAALNFFLSSYIL